MHNRGQHFREDMVPGTRLEVLNGQVGTCRHCVLDSFHGVVAYKLADDVSITPRKSVKGGAQI